MTRTEDWSESTSSLYRRLAQVAVPRRVEQTATMLSLIPFCREESFSAIELSSGEGRLSAALMEAYPSAAVTALDYERSMREETANRLHKYGDRASVAEFDIRSTDWFGCMDGVDLVVTSLAIHHLDDAQKQAFFTAAHERLSSRSALLIADLVNPCNRIVEALFASTWDSEAEAAARESRRSEQLLGMFKSEGWNLYRHPDPEVDKPSTLFDQLQWIKEAGFSEVDCFWMTAGHAIFGGYATAIDEAQGIPYEEALGIARTALHPEADDD